ncbi:DUF4368 domain-containing protein [Paenibacillus koleovorans]|nr:DUF4368 domain-containing protein [Paenibacillus koleovorans]
MWCNDAEKINGKRVQRIEIYYRFVGLICEKLNYPNKEVK